MSGCYIHKRNYSLLHDISTRETILHAISTRESSTSLLSSLVRIVITFLMVCEYNSNVLTALSLAIYLARLGGIRPDEEGVDDVYAS
jgi:hypothetical protein